VVPAAPCASSVTYLVDILALELRDELLKTLIVSLDTDGLEDLLDVGGGRRGVATKAKEKVSREMLHCDGELAKHGKVSGWSL
jgi:hypothetical protein